MWLERGEREEEERREGVLSLVGCGVSGEERSVDGPGANGGLGLVGSVCRRESGRCADG